MYERNPLLITKKFREYLLSAILMSSAVSLATVVDSMIVGTLLGSVALSAVGLTAPVIFGINLLHLLFCVGGLTGASIFKGRRDAMGANHLFTVSLAGGISCITLYAAAVWALAEPLSAALAQGNAEVQAQVLAYVRPIVLAGPPLAFSFGLAQFHRADGNPKAAAVVALTANLVNLVLDYVLIRYAGMGIAGAGLSTALGYVAGVGLVMPYVFSKKRTFRFVWPGRELCKRLSYVLRVGLPKGLNQGTSLLRSMVLNAIIMATLRSPGMAAMTVCLNALAIASIFIGSASDTLLPIVGTLYGEGDAVGIRGAVKAAGRAMLIASVLIVMFFLGWPQTIGGWFGITSNQDLHVMIPALRMFALSLPFYAINNLLQNFYATTGREKLASVIAVLDGFVFVVLFALALTQIDGRLFWLCYLLSEIATLGAVLWAGLRVRREENVRGMLLLGEEEPGALWEVTIPAEVEAATGVSEQIIAFGIRHGLTPVLANRMGVAVEEMAVNTAKHGRGKNKGTTLDIRVRLTPSQLVVSLRDDGIPFDPTVYPEKDGTSFAVSGIEVVRRMATKSEYTHQLGFNTTVFAFDRE
ncbi:MAG: MATE family efflux transporter [Eubacteriales bacterium]|nr:MATE family efflux transporter [Christensenellaceae bacterium]MEA5064766.1 MATE family efflux transporter [Eubacteriales bacterium]